MIKSQIFSKETNKTVEEVSKLIKLKAKDYGFIIRYDTDMAKEFNEHNVNVDDDFEYRTIMLCIPQKAYNSIKSNSNRAAIIAPKQISILRNNNINKTIISHLIIGEDFLKQILPNDEKIKESLPASCMKVVELINNIIKDDKEN